VSSSCNISVAALSDIKRKEKTIKRRKRQRGAKKKGKSESP
jgi:hypothetical protein